MRELTIRRAPGEWLDGAPRRITTATLALDRRIVAHMKCSQCKRRGLRFHPERSADGRRYRIRTRCPGCFHEDTA